MIALRLWLLRLLLGRRPGWESELASDDLLGPDLLRYMRAEAREANRGR